MAGVYSFKNQNATLAGPGGVLNLADGAAAAEEGFSIQAVTDKNIMTIGADGKGQHSLIANDACILTIRLLKTSPLNAALMIMYNLQSASSLLWGANVFTAVDSARGDFTGVQAVAFKKIPDLNYGTEAGINEWVFDGIARNTILGSGQ